MSKHGKNNKHNKNKQNSQAQQKVPQSSVAASQKSSEGLLPEIAGIAKDMPKLDDGGEQPRADEIQAGAEILSGVENKLSDEEKNALSELKNELKNAVDAYREAKTAADAKTVEQDSRAEGLQEKDEQLTAREGKLKEKEDSIAKRENAVGEREANADKWTEAAESREADLRKREAAADAGFMARETEWKNKAAEALTQERKTLEEEKKTFKEATTRLAHDQEKCACELADYEGRKQALEEDRAALKKEYDERAKALKGDYDVKVADLNTAHENEIQRKNRTIEDLQDCFNQIEDLRARMGGHSPEEITAIIDDLQNENGKLKLRLQQVCSPEHQRELENNNRDLKEQNERLIAAKVALERERNQLREKIVDIDGLVDLNRTLETHNKALEAAQGELENRVNELTSKLANQKIFEEFCAIDERCSAPYKKFEPSDDKSLKDFVDALGYRLTQHTPNLYYAPETLQLFVGGLAMSRLILLQGISGTGKTKLAQAFSAIVGDNFDGKETEETRKRRERCSCIVPVQAGWRDNQDLLGYYNAFEKKFYEKLFSKGVYAASTPMFEDRLFFVILDEMNLSHPEQYFADFISAMEQANSTSDEFEVELLSGISKEVMEDQNQWPKGLRGEKLVVPPNVWFVGTANHDETTMEFADKTYDRAHVMVMERNAGKPGYKNVGRGAAHWSASALRGKFEEAQESLHGKADAVKEKLEGLRDFLKTEFDVAFGNRLERQIDDFVPVVCAAGGNEILALDHLIATKIVRRGKVTGLFGVQRESLEELCSKVKEIGLEENSQTVRLLRQDIASKERGG